MVLNRLSTIIPLWPFSSSRESRDFLVVPHKVLFVTVLSGNEAIYRTALFVELLSKKAECCLTVSYREGLWIRLSRGWWA